MSFLDLIKNSNVYKRLVDDNEELKIKTVRKMNPLYLLLLQVNKDENLALEIIVTILAIESHFGKNDYGWDIHDKLRALQEKNNNREILEKLFEVFEARPEVACKPSIHINEQMLLVDDISRLACCIYFNIETITTKIEDTESNLQSKDWFMYNFEKEEYKQIEQKYTEIKASIDFKTLLEEVFNHELKNENRQQFYQSQPDLGITGMRSTLDRFQNYNLEQYLNKEHDVLEIGCNVGFFTNYVAQYVKTIKGIDVKPMFCEIGRVTSSFLEYRNTNFKASDFINYATVKDYDAIFSFEVHDYLKLPLKEYLTRLAAMLNPNGFILLENKLKENAEENLDTQLPEMESAGYTLIHQGIIHSPNHFDKQFILLRKT